MTGAQPRERAGAGGRCGGPLPRTNSRRGRRAPTRAPAPAVDKLGGQSV
eukprot:CAMPEP_0170447306 /NCGR_PEP_ID=MMETSP0117_2-20130122/50091_1 /TAXON_ID=400756 /ORGANISM="Durinskia baltica, Strain CSIRO CS-38" /LENGTH=48 /DNA_ID= /DNA_START= /DNA_END= /DNA_ORIENTATION=